MGGDKATATRLPNDLQQDVYTPSSAGHNQATPTASPGNAPKSEKPLPNTQTDKKGKNKRLAWAAGTLSLGAAAVGFMMWFNKIPAKA